MKMTMMKNATFAFIFGLGLGFSGCSSSDEQQEDEQMEASDQEEAAEAADATEYAEESEEEAMEQEASEEGEDGYVASEEAVEEPTLPEGTVDAEQTEEEEVVEETVEEEQMETAESTPAAQEKWTPQGNTGESFDYVIKRGDTVSGVAKLVYGTMSQWREISNATGLSNPDLIYPGSVLKIPLLNDQARQFNDSYANVENDEMDGEQVSVTVEEGDTLSSIAEAQLGDSSNWAHIYGQNRTSISDPDVLRVGQVLTFANKAH